jgi:hypothetical protein
MDFDDLLSCNADGFNGNRECRRYHWWLFRRTFSRTLYRDEGSKNNLGGVIIGGLGGVIIGGFTGVIIGGFTGV